MSLSSKILITTEKGDEIIVYLRSSKAPLNAARLLRMLPLHTRIYFTHDRKIAYFTLTKRLTLEKPSRKIPRGSLFYWVQRNVLAFSLEDTVVQGYACIIGDIDKENLEILANLENGMKITLRSVEGE